MTNKGLKFEDINIGDKIPELVKKPVTETQLVMYSGASGDFNPLHTVHEAGVKAGFGGVIAHGQLILAFLGQLLTDWLGNRALTKMSVSFRGVTRPKDVITCKGTVTNKYSKEGKNTIEMDIMAQNQQGESVIVGKSTAVLL